mmetsp:Transcript_4929/g.10490  ORF Transcript_4929/g.10490 Transcript_4929/m.10490 type:complete len:89 (-) Transcript_4929:47-313(-)
MLVAKVKGKKKKKRERFGYVVCWTENNMSCRRLFPLLCCTLRFLSLSFLFCIHMLSPFCFFLAQGLPAVFNIQSNLNYDIILFPPFLN